jgi:virginiamycin B lyase
VRIAARCLSLGPLLTAALVASLVAAPPALAQPAESAFVYWVNLSPNTIGRGTIDGNPDNVNQRLITVGTSDSGGNSVQVVAVDRQYIYWTGDPSVIGRANLDGSDVNPNFMTLVCADWVAVNDQHIYWVNPCDVAIGRANLDGSQVNRSFITLPEGSSPFAVAVNGQHIYWSAVPGTLDSRIGRANLDGSNVNPNFIIRSGDLVFGLAVDYQHIYWTNLNAGTIGRANLDGSNVNPNFITGANTNNSWGVAVDYEHIYWASTMDQLAFPQGLGTIGRANLDGSDANDRFITADTSVGTGCDQQSPSRCGPGAVAVSVPTRPLCLRQDSPPLPTFGGAVFARPLDPASSNANVVVLPTGSTWSEASPCAGNAQGAAEVIAHPTSIAVTPGAAVLLKDDTGLVSAWGAQNVGAGDPAPIFFPGRPGWTPATVEVVDPKTLLDTYNGCRGCVLPENISFTPTTSNPNVAYQGDLSGASLRGATLTGHFIGWHLSGSDLTGAVLSGADLTGADLTGAVLSGATLAQTVVDRTVFDGSDLRGTHLVGLRYSAPPSFSGVRVGPFNGSCTKFENTDLRNTGLAPIKPDPGCETSPLLPFSTAPLELLTLLARTYQASVDFANARFVVDAGNRAGLAGADLHGINLTQVSFLGFPADFTRTNFDGAALQQTSFELAELSGATFRNAQAPEASFLNARLAAQGNVPGASFAGSTTSLVGAVFVEADVSGVSFQSADLTRAAFNRALAVGTDFNSAKAPNAVFNGAHIYGDGQAFDSARDLQGIDFVNAVLAGDVNQGGGFDLTGADLTAAKFDGAQCIGCNFTSATLDGASFSDAYLLGAVFSSATLTGANLLGAWLYCGDLANGSCVKVPGSEPRWAWPLALGSGEAFGPVPFAPTDLMGVRLDDVTTCPDGKDGSIPPAGCDNHLLPDPAAAPPIPAPCSAAGPGACPTPTSTLFDASSVGSPLAVAAATPPTWVTAAAARGYYVALDDGTVRFVGEGSPQVFAGRPGQHCPSPTQACGDGGPATQALLGGPTGLAVGLDGSVYLADPVLHRVRRIDPSGRISTVAGTGVSCAATAAVPADQGQAFPAPELLPPLLESPRRRLHSRRLLDPPLPRRRVASAECGDGGPATAATLNGPYGVWVDPNGHLWIADGHRGIRGVLPDGTITTECCQLGAGGLGLLRGVVGDIAGNLYATSNAPDYLVKIDLATGQVTTVVGTGTSGYNGNTDPNTGLLLPGTSVQVNQPTGLSVGLNGNVLFADSANNLIRAYVPSTTHVIDDLAGQIVNRTPQRGFNGDGHWATDTQLNLPSSVTATRGALLVVADTSNRRVRQVGPAPVSPTLEGEEPRPEVIVSCRPDPVWSCQRTLGTPRATLSASTGAVTISQEGIVFATGRALSPLRGDLRFLVTEQRPLVPGHYSLVIQGGGQLQEQTIWIAPGTGILGRRRP